MTDRYFIEQASCLSGEIVALSADESHHLVRVMRAKVGETVSLFNGRGAEWDGVVTAISRGAAQVRVVMQRPQLPEMLPRVTIAVALPKGERQKILVGKLTELGCNSLIPLQTTRSDFVVNAQVISRLKRYVIESAKQCQRCFLMKITESQSFEKVANNFFAADNKKIDSATTLRLLAHPPSDTDCGQRRIVDYFQNFKNFQKNQNEHESCASRMPQEVFILLGPAGGFTEEEVQGALSRGWKPLDLGTTRLRTETAAIAAMAKIADFFS